MSRYKDKKTGLNNVDEILEAARRPKGLPDYRLDSYDFEDEDDE